MSLNAESRAYADLAKYYEIFANAEDAPAYVYNFLSEVVKNKRVLDLGCGTGKYTKLLAPDCAEYIGIDQSEAVLSICQKKIENLPNSRLIFADAEQLPIPDACLDLIFSCWMLGTVSEVSKRDKILDECRRVLKPGGQIYLVENDYGGEFEDLRGKVRPDSQTAIYNNYLLEKQNFKIHARFDSHFSFSSADQAREVFDRIWGEEVANKVKNRRIEHKIFICLLAVKISNNVTATFI